MEEIELRNPGTVASCIDYGPPNYVFKRLFISFDATIKGFLKGCRPFVGVDGCF